MQHRSSVREPVFATDMGVQALAAPAVFIGAAILAELLVAIHFTTQRSQHDVGIDGVIEQADARRVVGNDVVGVDEIIQRAANRLPLFIGELPFIVFQHVDQHLQPGDFGGDVFGQFLGAGHVDEFGGSGLHFHTYATVGDPVMAGVDAFLEAGQFLVGER